jgi:hypothetical protein
MIDQQTVLEIADATVKQWQSEGKMPPLAWDFRGFAAAAIRAAIESVKQEAEHDAWTVVPDGEPYKRLIDHKTKWIVDRGYNVIGYVLAKKDDMCISYRSAVRWTNGLELFSFMHNTTPPTPSAAVAAFKKKAVAAAYYPSDPRAADAVDALPTDDTALRELLMVVAREAAINSDGSDEKLLHEIVDRVLND